MKRSGYLALGLLAAVSAWMLSGSIMGSVAPDPPRGGSREGAAPPMKVRVADLEAQPVMREVVVQGQLEPRRRVEVRAETGGQVVKLPLNKGAAVTRNQVLVRLAADDRPARLAEAEANLAQRRLELEAARTLRRRKMQSETRLKLAEAAVAAAEAQREVSRTELARTVIRAPFDGVLERRPVELGTLVERGDPVADVVDEEVLKAVGQVPQQSAGSLSLGQRVTVRLLDGRTVEGRLSYLARVAEPGTRSFRAEAEFPNRERAFKAGVSAELRIAVGETPAHFVSAAALTLDDRGRVGVKAVGEDRTVRFHPVSVVRVRADGVWVSGLPARIRIITRGQGFVAPGETVEPVPDA